MKSLIATLALVPTAALAAVDVNLQSLVKDVVVLIVVGIVIGLLILLVRKAPFIPAEWKAGIEYFIYFIAILLVISILLGMVGIKVVNFS